METPPRSDIESAVLERLALKGPLSRADLARELGITRTTAGGFVARLLEEGIVQLEPSTDAGKGRSVGRPGELLSLNPDHAHVIGVDAGIGFVLALRMDLAGEVRAIAREEIPRPDETPEALASLIVRLIERVAEGAPPIAGVSVAVPGIITREGHVMRAPFLEWQDVPLRDLIAEPLRRFGALSLENDANALAMGEVIRGHVSPDDLNIFFSMDVGVGGSIIREGRLMDGQSGLAGEFGHIFVHIDAGRDAVRLEDFIGRGAILRRYHDLGGEARDLETFLADLDAGLPAARRIAREWVEVMAQGLATITSVLNPGCIVFGGSVTALMERVMPDLDAAYEARLMHGTVKPRFVIADSAAHSVARGCADLRRAGVFRPS